MKFYKYNYNNASNIEYNKLTCIYTNNYTIIFYKNGDFHNIKNSAFFDKKYKQFYLNGTFYGYEDKFTKKSWRKFVKLKAFL